MTGTVIKAVPLTSFNTTGITAGYQAINTGGLPQICFALRIMNTSNIAVSVSYDGVNPHDVVLAGATLELPRATALGNGDTFFPVWQKRQVVYVAAAAPGVGLVYLSGYYV